MRTALVGGTGFIGGYLVDALLERGHKPVLLVRRGSEAKVHRAAECELVPGEVDVIGDLVRLLTNSEAVIYNVGILREFPASGITFESLQYAGLARVVEAARACNVPRLLLMSANGVRDTGTAYQTTKYRAEREAFNSGLDTTVFRPSVVFGDPRAAMEFATQLRDDMILPLRPALGFYNAFGSRRGEFSMSPVHVEDVADAFVAALSDADTYGQTYTLAGPESLTWATLLRRIAQASGKEKWIVPMPIELLKLAATFLDRLPQFPVTRDQLSMLAEGNSGDPTELAALIGRPPRRFDETGLSYLRETRRAHS